MQSPEKAILVVGHLTTILKQISSSTRSQFADVQWPFWCLERAILTGKENPRLARKLLKLVAAILEFLSEQSQLKVCMALLGMAKELIANLEACLWQGVQIKLSQVGLLKEILVVAFKANNVCSLQDHSLEALKEYAECFYKIGFEQGSSLGDFIFKAYLNTNKEEGFISTPDGEAVEKAVDLEGEEEA